VMLVIDGPCSVCREREREREIITFSPVIFEDPIIFRFAGEIPC
jgi:hypothetical protein